MLFSGRTSRLEIRKLLGECLFWRFKRTKSARHDMKYPTHAFLVDDDDEDTDRSIQTKGPTPYSSLTVQSSNRHNDLSPKTSSGNFSSQQSRASTTSTTTTTSLWTKIHRESVIRPVTLRTMFASGMCAAARTHLTFSFSLSLSLSIGHTD